MGRIYFLVNRENVSIVTMNIISLIIVLKTTDSIFIMRIAEGQELQVYLPMWENLKFLHCETLNSPRPYMHDGSKATLEDVIETL